jgi:hypothetical protein
LAAEQATAPLTHGNLALAQQPANVVQFKPRLSVVPEPVKGKSKAGKSKTKKKTTNKPELKTDKDWLKDCFPKKLDGKPAPWSLRRSEEGTGAIPAFNVVYRIDKRYNGGVPVNLRFPRISQQMFLTLKGKTDAQRREQIEKYVRSHLRDAIEQGDSRARIVAGKLRVLA